MSDDERERHLKELFGSKQFDVEHSLNMYASSYVTMPAFGIYDASVLKQFSEQLKTCHIYIIGLLPKVRCIDVKKEDNAIVSKYDVGGVEVQLDWPTPEGISIETDGEGNFYGVDKAGRKVAPTNSMIMQRLSGVVEGFGFKVLYIGQAFGKDGSRSALDRLKKHETLQKIAVQGIPEDRSLTILMLEIMPANRLITMFNPWAIEKDQGGERINKGLDKLFDTDEAERTTIYEASLIRYFQPEFNTKFKNKFPSTRNDVLQSCYDKDIAAVTAEICFDDMEFMMFSDVIERKHFHIAHHDLHDKAARKVFFAKM